VRAEHECGGGRRQGGWRHAISVAVVTLSVLLVASGLLLVASEHKSDGVYARVAKERPTATESEWERLCDENPDICGWISVDKTSINYPVVRASEADPEFYLKHDFDRNPSQAGCPFVDYRCDPNGMKPTIYGHHMGASTIMFSELYSCYKQESFDRLGWAHWSTPERGMRNLEPLCAMSVYKDDADAQTFTFDNTDTYREWLRRVIERASAKAPNAEELAEKSESCVALVTCSSPWAGRPWRTVVYFSQSEG
jgi:sortase B